MDMQPAAQLEFDFPLTQHKFTFSKTLSFPVERQSTPKEKFQTIVRVEGKSKDTDSTIFCEFTITRPNSRKAENPSVALNELLRQHLNASNDT
jgi:hypothetical protein